MANTASALLNEQHRRIYHIHNASGAATSNSNNNF
jgi:hypothetical protein